MTKKKFIIDELNTSSDAFKDLLKGANQGSKEDIKHKIKIDPSLQAFIPPLTEEESQQLENNLLAEGIRDALLLWKNPENEEEYLLIDGHNRFRIAEKHQIEFQVKILEFTDKSDVQNWMILNQLGKRNLTEAQKAYLRGKQYQQEKQNIGRPEKNVDKMSTLNPDQKNVDILSTLSPNQKNVDILSTLNPVPQRTSEKLAQQHKVSAKTIERDEKYATQIDWIVGEDTNLKWKILNKDIDIPKSVLPVLSNQPSAQILKIRKNLKEGIPLKQILDEIEPKIAKENTEPLLDELKKQVLKKIQTAFKTKDKQLIDALIQDLKDLKDKF